MKTPIENPPVVRADYSQAANLHPYGGGEMSDTPRTDAFILRGLIKDEWNWRHFARQLERELNAALSANAELLERLQESRESHLIATAKKVQTIQQQAVMMERLASELHALANMPEHDQDDAHRLRHIAGKALVAYESANPEPIAKPIDEAIKRMEAVPALELNKLHFDLFDYGNFNDIEAIRARLIQAAKGEQP